MLAAQDRKLLAIDVVRMLLPPSLEKIPATSLVVSDAVRSTAGRAGRLAVGRGRAPRGARGPARPGGRELPAGHGRAAVVAAAVPHRLAQRRAAGRDADGADHAGPGAAAAVGGAGPLVDLGAAGGAAAAPGVLVRDPCRLRTHDGVAQAGGAGRDALPGRVVGGAGPVHPAGPGLPEVEHLRAGGLAEPVGRAGHGRRQLHVGGVRRPDRGRGRGPRRSADAAGPDRGGLRAGAGRPVRGSGRRPGSGSS